MGRNYRYHPFGCFASGYCGSDFALVSMETKDCFGRDTRRKGGAPCRTCAPTAQPMPAWARELPKLKPEEFRLVKAKVDDRARAQRRTIGDASVRQRHPRPIPFEHLSARRRQQRTASSARAANTGEIVLREQGTD